MSQQLAAAELFVLAFAVCAALSWLVANAAAPMVLEQLRAWEPSRRHVAVLALSAAPVLMTIALFLAVLAPSIASLWTPALDHCLVHDDGHAHLCFVHLPAHAPHVSIWAMSASLATFGLIAIGSVALRVIAALRAARRLLRAVGPGPDGVSVVDGEAAFCGTVGLLSPSIVVSRSVLGALHGGQREALLAHERSHVRRRDALTRALARALSWPYVRATREQLHRALDLAAEQACDEAAGCVVGDRLLVAEAIVRTERLLAATPAHLPQLALGLGAVAIEERVRALTEPPVRAGRLGPWLVIALATLILLLAFGDSLHHVAESLLSTVLE